MILTLIDMEGLLLVCLAFICLGAVFVLISTFLE